MITKEYILNNLTTKSGLKSNYKKIFNKTPEELYCILNNIHQIPHCLCGKNKSFRKFTFGYNEYCSPHCRNTNKWTEESKKKGVRKRKEFYIKNPEKMIETHQKISKINKEVWSSGTDLRINQTQKHKETKRKNFIKEVDDMKKIYYREVNIITKNQPINELENFNKRGRGGVEGAYHLDHKYSIIEGFNNNILPHIIGNISNLEMIPAGINCSKQGECSMTINKLWETYEN